MDVALKPPFVHLVTKTDHKQRVWNCDFAPCDQYLAVVDSGTNSELLVYKTIEKQLFPVHWKRTFTGKIAWAVKFSRATSLLAVSLVGSIHLTKIQGEAFEPWKEITPSSSDCGYEIS